MTSAPGPARCSSLSVVVPTKDRFRLLTGCLDALQRSLRPGDELIVADSASADHRIRTEAETRSLSYVRCDLPGASRARNAGWRAARNDLVAFIDDDIRVEGDWADAVVSSFGTFADAAFLTGKIGIPVGPRPDRPIAIKDDDAPQWLDRSTGGVIGHSANLTVRRSILGVLGGFDEQLGAGARYRGAEDLDLFDRLFAAGYRGRYEPAAAATHLHWRKDPDILKLEWGYGIGGGARLAKLIRTDRRRALWELKVHLWRAGIKAMLDEIGAKRPFLALSRAARTVGVLVGFLARTFDDLRGVQDCTDPSRS